MTTLVRVPLTLAAALAFHVSLSPPSTPLPPISSLSQPGDRRAVCAVARFLAALLTKGLYWASALTDTFVLLAPHVPSSLSDLPSLPHIPIPAAETLLAWIKNPTSLSLDPNLFSSLTLPSSIVSLLPQHLTLPLATAIAGTTLAIAGAFLRLQAYDALDQFYACPNPGPHACEPPAANRGKGHAHALIVNGPYAFIRHPGYAGLVLCTTGLALSHLGTFGIRLGSYGTWSWPLSWAGARVSTEPALLVAKVSAGMRSVALACAVLITVVALRRITGEERALRARFKGEWESWTRVVRYKLVPGVY